jgi:hypothetical protein
MRNKVGGNKAKKMGRKHVVVRDVALVVKKSDLEHYGFVDKVFGGRLCSAVNTSGKKYKIHILQDEKTTKSIHVFGGLGVTNLEDYLKKVPTGFTPEEQKEITAKRKTSRYTIKQK